jgi:hypothetical protein
VCYDEKHKRKYYYNYKTKESKWTLPESVLVAGPTNSRQSRASAASHSSRGTASASEVDFSDNDDLDLPA